MQRRGLSFTLVAASLLASAQSSAQPLADALRSCAKITEDSQRLACFDRQVAALSDVAASPGAGTSPGPTSAAAAGAAASPASSGGSAQPVGSPPPGARPAMGNAPVAPALSPEQKLGLSAEGVRKLEAKQGIPSPPEVKGLTAHIASVSHGASGRMVLTLDNGQVWRQAETRPAFEAHPGDVATISSGALGTFWLATSRHNWTRVERIP